MLAARSHICLSILLSITTTTTTMLVHGNLAVLLLRRLCSSGGCQWPCTLLAASEEANTGAGCLRLRLVCLRLRAAAQPTPAPTCTLPVAGVGHVAAQQGQQQLLSGSYLIRLEGGRDTCLFTGFLSLKDCSKPNVVDLWKVKDFSHRQW